MSDKPFVKHDTWDGEPVLRFGAGGYEGVVVPSLGGMLVRLTEVRKGIEILHSTDCFKTFLSRPKIYGIPTIFPPNRIRDGKFDTPFKTYSLPINSPDGHHCHGLIGGEPWDIVCAGVEGDSAVVEVSYANLPGKIFHESFGHEFVFSNRYAISPRGLEHRYSVTNRGTIPMPAGVGFHLAFNIPFNPASRRENVRLRVSIGKRWELDDRSIPTGKAESLSCIEANYRNGGLPVAGFPIRDHYAAEHLTVDGESFHGVVIQDDAVGQRIVYRVGDTFKHWMIWNEFGESGFVCPEPMTWMIDAPNVDVTPDDVSGYRILGDGETLSDVATICVQEKRSGRW